MPKFAVTVRTRRGDEAPMTVSVEGVDIKSQADAEAHILRTHPSLKLMSPVDVTPADPTVNALPPIHEATHVEPDPAKAPQGIVVP